MNKKKYEYYCDWGHAELINPEDKEDRIKSNQMDGMKVQFDGRKGILHLGITTSEQGGHGIGNISTPHYFIAFENCDLWRVGMGDLITIGWDDELDLG